MEKTLSFQVGRKLYDDIRVASEISGSSISDWVRRCCEKELNGYSFVSEILHARPRPLERLLAHAREIKKIERRSK